MRLLLVRHGETEVNRAGLTLGRSDVPLNEKGLLQAQRLAQALEGREVTAVYSSPLKRARATAEAIAAALGLAVEVQEDLVELDIGETEGMNSQQLWERFPDFMASWTGPEGHSVAAPGSSEDMRRAQERAWGVVERLQLHHDNQAVVVVTHAFVILSILCRALGLELSHFRRLRHGVAAITTLDVRPDRATLLSLNDACHLEGLQTVSMWDERARHEAAGPKE